MRRNLLLLLLWLAGLLAVDAQTLSRKEVETYVINQYGKRWKDIALYLGEKDTLDKDNALTFEKTISVRGKSKNELFVDLNYWFLKTFSNASSSIEMAYKVRGKFYPIPHFRYVDLRIGNNLAPSTRIARGRNIMLRPRFASLLVSGF
jgi:hypothetical protein